MDDAARKQDALSYLRHLKDRLKDRKVRRVFGNHEGVQSAEVSFFFATKFGLLFGFGFGLREKNFFKTFLNALAAKKERM